MAEIAVAENEVPAQFSRGLSGSHILYWLW